MRMLWSAVALVVAGAVVLGQEHRFGLFGEGILSWMATDEEGISTKGMRIGGSYGLWYEYFFSEHYGITSGLYITHIGGIAEYAQPFRVKLKDTTVITVPSATFQYSYQYVEFPACFKFRTSELGYVRFFGQFGGVVGILWRAKARSDQIDYFSSKRRIFDGKPLNLQIMLSAGIEYTLAGQTALLVRVGYFGGFTDVTGHKKAVENVDNGVVRFNSLRLTVGVLF